MGGSAQLGELQHHLLGLHDISLHARKRASVLAAAKAHQQVPVPRRRSRPTGSSGGLEARDGLRGVPKCHAGPQERHSKWEVNDHPFLPARLVVTSRPAMLRSSFASWKDLVRARERWQLQAQLLAHSVFSGWQHIASWSHRKRKSSEACSLPQLHAVEQGERLTTIAKLIFRGPDASPMAMFIAWRELARASQLEATRIRLKDCMMLAAGWTAAAVQQAANLLVQCVFHAWLAVKAQGNHPERAHLRAELRQSAEVVGHPACDHDTAAADVAPAFAADLAATRLRHTELLEDCLRAWRCSVHLEATPEDTTERDALGVGVDPELLKKVWKRWHAAIAKSPRRTNLQAAVSTVSLAWLREDRQVKRTAWISWHTVVLASEYARDLRLLQCRLSAAIGHAGHLAYSQQELRSKATLLHVLLSWRVLALQAAQERLRRRSPGGSTSAKAEKLQDSERSHRVSSDLSLQRQVFLAWCRTVEALRMAGPVQGALEEQDFMHRELMRLKEESKHRAIDLLEVMALSREAAALTGGRGKSCASKKRYNQDIIVFTHANALAKVDDKKDAAVIRIAEDFVEDDLNGYTILQALSPAEKKALVEECTPVPSMNQAMGALCGMAVGDALGHPFEYITVTDVPGTSRFDLATLEFHGEFNKFGCKRGQWTDDASMGFCMADSFIVRQSFDGGDLRRRFWCWWFRGYNNAFRKDVERESRKSIGLGGNTQKSLEPLTACADTGVPPEYESTSEDAGNGSLMRLAAVPIFFHALPLQDLYSVARKSSLTTHPGFVAAEACAFLAHIVRQAMRLPPGSTTAREFLDGVSQEFYVTSGLASQSGPGFDEMQWLVSSEPVRDTERCWNWKHETLDIAGTLAARGWSYNGYPVSADYFGSYSLDGLAAALWAVYHTRSFDEAVTRAVNLNGDADSFGSITGQIAGAFYGFSAINPQFLDWLCRWDDYDTAVRALMLYQLGPDEQRSK
ncbi:tri1 [Symbiodinium sp. KB8]|nr:tri1 [Symbiodinium sp. KB8]